MLKKGLNTSGKIGLCIILILLVFSTLAQNTIWLLISRFLQGGLIGVLFILGPLMISLAVPKDKLGYGFGLLSSSGYIGATSAPIISGIISQYFHWRLNFLIPIPILIIIIILLVKLNEEIDINQDPLDKVGSVLWIFGTIGILYGISIFLTIEGHIILIIGVILMVIFYFYENKIKYPLFKVSLLKNKAYVILNSIALICSLITNCTTLVISYYLYYSIGLGGALIGIILSILPTVRTIIAPITGKLADRYDARTITTIALGILAATMFLFTIINKLPIYWIIIILLLQSLGHAMCSPANNKQIITSVNKKDIKDANGLLSNLKAFAQIMGPLMFTIIFVIVTHTGIDSIDANTLIESISVLYTIFMILAIIGIILMIYLKYVPSKNKNASN